MSEKIGPGSSVRVVYAYGSKPEYVGRVEKSTPDHLTIELNEKNEKGKSQFRTFHRAGIVSLQLN